MKSNPVVSAIIRSRPEIRRRVRIARINQSAEQFVGRALRGATIFAVCAFLLGFMLLDKVRGRELLVQNLLLISLASLGGFLGSFLFLMNTLEVYIKRQERLLNRDVLFIGRYLLIKLQSGVPFYQALIDASHGNFGIASKYMREIVDDIELGTPIEQALSTAADMSPSNEFRQILWQVNTALRSGVDVTTTLRSILTEISGMQILEVERYGKKLSSLSLFYMLLAIIVPSLGLTLFVSFSSFLGLKLAFIHLVGVVFVMMFVQFMFMSLFRSIRPQINL